MPAVVTIDKSGRIVIPNETRAAQRIRPGTKFLLVGGRHGRIWLQRLDPLALAAQIREETEGVDLEPIIAKIEAELEGLAAECYPSLARR